MKRPNPDEWESRFQARISDNQENGADAAHDLAHIERVVETAKKLCELEGGIAEVVIPAAWLHDFVVLRKDDPRRAKASRLSAREAEWFLQAEGYPGEYLPAIVHAIEAHSFSAGIPAESLEAQIVQDADRLDALGAIGIARCFSCAGQFGSRFYDHRDPYAGDRKLDDRRFALDHFFVKLFKIAHDLHTPSAREEADRRVEFMRAYLRQFGDDIGVPFDD